MLNSQNFQIIKTIFFFNEQDEYFFKYYYKMVFFILSNILFFNIAITAHNNIKENYLSFGLYLILSIFTVLFLNSIFKLKNLWCFPIYSFFYLLLGLAGSFNIIDIFSFDIVFCLIINFFIYLTIKSFNWIVPHNNYEKSLLLLDFMIIEDFNKEMAYHYYNMPFYKDNEKERSLREELIAMEKYNSMIIFKNKIKSEQLSKYIGNAPSVNIPKSTLLVIYKTILDFCYQGFNTVESNPIQFKIDWTNVKNDLLESKYICEFKIEIKNLKSIKVKDMYKNFSVKKEHHEEFNENIINIKNGIDGVYAIIKKNKMGVKIKHGLKNEEYVIRVTVDLNQSNSAETLFEQLNYEKIEQIKNIELSKSSGLTTNYQTDNKQEKKI